MPKTSFVYVMNEYKIKNNLDFIIPRKGSKEYDEIMAIMKERIK